MRRYPSRVTQRPAIIGAVLDAWDDLDRVTAGMSDAEATAVDHGSSYAWTVAHLANQVDGWVNVRFAGADPDPVVGLERYRFGGDGRAETWAELQEAAGRVHRVAATFLETLAAPDLERSILYPGSLPELAGRRVSLRYTLLRVLVHHYFHIGEIASKRSAAGTAVGDYPGAMPSTAETDR